MAPILRETDVKSILTKSNLPLADYSVNPYTGCTHACRYCYASFMKRFTNHPEPWGGFLDVKYWPALRHPERYAGKELPDGQVLTLCLNNYRASGAGGYEAYAGCEVVRDQPEEISELIIRYVDAHREIRVDRTQWLKVNY